jgi:hypothetical protein
MNRRFPAPWTVEQIPGGYVVKDANDQSLAYVYGCETRADADIANVLTMDEARRIASNIGLRASTLGLFFCAASRFVLLSLDTFLGRLICARVEQ